MADREIEKGWQGSGDIGEDERMRGWKVVVRVASSRQPSETINAVSGVGQKGGQGVSCCVSQRDNSYVHVR